MYRKKLTLLLPHVQWKRKKQMKDGCVYREQLDSLRCWGFEGQGIWTLEGIWNPDILGSILERKWAIQGACGDGNIGDAFHSVDCLLSCCGAYKTFGVRLYSLYLWMGFSIYGKKIYYFNTSTFTFSQNNFHLLCTSFENPKKKSSHTFITF